MLPFIIEILLNHSWEPLFVNCHYFAGSWRYYFLRNWFVAFKYRTIHNCHRWWKVKSQSALEPRASSVPCQHSIHPAIETQYFDWPSITWITGDIFPPRWEIRLQILNRVRERWWKVVTTQTPSYRASALPIEILRPDILNDLHTPGCPVTYN